MTNNTHSFIVWHDSIGSQANTVECLSYETNPDSKDSVNIPPLAAGDFVIIQDPEQNLSWMAQVLEPQRNLPLQGLSRESPSAIAVFERILSGEINKSIFLNQVYYYCLQLIGQINPESGRLGSVQRRPRAGSLGFIASAESVVKALDLPAVFKNQENLNSLIGRIDRTNIPIAVDWLTFKQHILVAGATGSGKSNTVANLIKAAQAHGACVIIYDQKPDYQDIAAPNDESKLFGNWAEADFSPFGLKKISRYTLFQGEDPQKGEELIAVRARDVSPGMLVHALFSQPDEGNQRDLFQALLSEFTENNSKKDWTLFGFKRWILDARRSGQLQKLAIANGWGELNDRNVDATLRKMEFRKMKWLDSLESTQTTPRGGVFGDTKNQDNESSVNPTKYFQPLNHIDTGKILVIRTNADGREYGLFLTYMLREVYNLKRFGKIKCPIVNIVDESQDIFRGEGTNNDAIFTMNDIIRKGRSKDISFVIAAQSVSQIPDSVLTNMNSRIIHRQNSVEELRKAIPSASRDLMENSLTFGPGEALVSIIGARSIIHAEMAPSPFNLTKFSAGPRMTLAEQQFDVNQG